MLRSGRVLLDGEACAVSDGLRVRHGQGHPVRLGAGHHENGRRENAVVVLQKNEVLQGEGRRAPVPALVLLT